MASSNIVALEIQMKPELSMDSSLSALLCGSPATFWDFVKLFFVILSCHWFLLVLFGNENDFLLFSIG